MYKNVQHYRHTVHRYLDAIWKVSNKNRDARSTMYSWLSIQMDLLEEKLMSQNLQELNVGKQLRYCALNILNFLVKIYLIKRKKVNRK